MLCLVKHVMVWDEAPTREPGVGEAEDPFNSAVLHSFCTCSSRVQFLGLVEQSSTSLTGWAAGPGEGDKAGCRCQGHGRHKLGRVLSSLALLSSFAFTQGVA